MNCNILFFFSILTLPLYSCTQEQAGDKPSIEPVMNDEQNPSGNLDTATFGAGCFWCVEAVFQELKGVKSVRPGYAGGHVKNPTYKEVCTGTTGAAEVAQIVFDPEVISYEVLLDVFFHTHDPTTMNRQGADVGTQYRSAIFYHNDEQKEQATEVKRATDFSGLWSDPIVTEIVPINNFSFAEDYHNNYFQNNPNQPYCSAVIRPKVEKFRKKYEDLLKK